MFTLISWSLYSLVYYFDAVDTSMRKFLHLVKS